jgi:hypothetical protein
VRDDELFVYYPLRLVRYDISADDLVADVFLVGPPVVYVEVTTAWYYYTSGVLTAADSDCAGTSSAVSHAVQLVGYTQDPDAPYWCAARRALRSARARRPRAPPVAR